MSLPVSVLAPSEEEYHVESDVYARWAWSPSAGFSETVFIEAHIDPDRGVFDRLELSKIQIAA